MDGEGAEGRTRGYLKSFGVTVTMYEERMLKLIEEASLRDRSEVLEEALRLNIELSRRTIMMMRYVEELQQELTRRLLEKLGLSSGAGG